MLFPASLAMKSMVRAVPQLGGASRGGSRRLSLFANRANAELMFPIYAIFHFHIIFFFC